MGIERSGTGWHDPYPEEVIDGKTVCMGPSYTNHNIVSSNIAYMFHYHVDKKRSEIVMRRFGVRLTEKDLFIPDVIIVCDHGKIKMDSVYGAPDLVVEVLSARSVNNDRKYKKAVYEQSGVREYWIVSPEARSIEQHLLENGRLMLNEVYALYPDYALEVMKEEERAALVTKFKCSLFDDLDIDLNKIFSGMVP